MDADGQGTGSIRVKTICLHGPESTGKSTLAQKLAAHFGCEAVPEYGRTYCEEHGTEIDMAALVHIGHVQNARNRTAAALPLDWAIFDTDALITAVWADMMFGRRDPWFDRADPSADLYLLLDIDLPFVDDGLRVYSDLKDRQRFFDLSKAELDRRGLRYRIVRGVGDARFTAALGAIEECLTCTN
jgi:NadR type nicotinamide-nucleotide adenylyltransferase